MDSAAFAARLREDGFEVETILHFGRFRPVWENSFVWARKR